MKECDVPELQAAFSCTKFNIDEIQDVYYMCNDLDVNSFRSQPLMLLGRGFKNQEKVALNHLEYKKY